MFQTVREGKDPTFFVVLFEDSAAMIGVLVAAAGIFIAKTFEAPVFDAIASIAIGVILCTIALWLAYEAKGLLVGESASLRLVESLEKIIVDDRSVERVGRVLTMHVGPNNILVNAAIEFESGLTLDDLREAVGRIERAMRASHEPVTRVFIEVAQGGGSSGRNGGEARAKEASS